MANVGVSWDLASARGEYTDEGAIATQRGRHNFRIYIIKDKKVRRVTLTGDYTINNQMQVHVRVHTPSVARHLTDSSAAAGRASTLRTLHGGTPGHPLLH